MIYTNTEQLADWLKKAGFTVLADQAEFELEASAYQRHLASLNARPESERLDAAAFRCLTFDVPPVTATSATRPEQILLQQDQILKAHTAQTTKHHARLDEICAEVVTTREQIAGLIANEDALQNAKAEDITKYLYELNGTATAANRRMDRIELELVQLQTSQIGRMNQLGEHVMELRRALIASGAFILILVLFLTLWFFLG